MKGGIVGRQPRRRPILLRYAATNMAVMALPIVLAGVFYAVTSSTVRDAVDGVAAAHLAASARQVDTRLQDIQRAAAQLSIDYDVNFYLNNEGPYSSIEEYDLRKISGKLASFKLGNEILSMLMIYFAGADYVAYDAGACPYLSFYGPIFSVRGLDAERWRDGALRAGGEERIVVGLETSYSERSYACALSIYPIGQGEYRRGAILGMIEEAGILKLLAGLPESFGGLVAVYDGAGSVVAATDPERERELRASRRGEWGDRSGRGGDAGAETVEASGSVYRLYEARSAVSDWTYLAAFDEGRALAGPKRVMVAAIIILLACFIVGTALSYLFARNNSKPVESLIRMILGEAGQAREGATSVFQRVEEAIAGLESEKRRLEGAVISASGMARTNLLQVLLAGGCRDRARLVEESAKVALELSGPKLVLMAGIGSAGVSVNEAGDDFCRAVARSGSRLEQGEYVVSLSPGEAAFILSAEPGEKPGARAEAVARMVRDETSADFRGALSFGAGASVEDPFLLTMSYAQAESARERAARSGSLDLLDFGTAGAAGELCAYPIDHEEAIMRAVRSANVDLLGSLLGSLRDSFVPGAGPEFESDLASALRGTALRLFAEFPNESSGLAGRLAVTRTAAPSTAIAEASAVLAELARLRESAKKSHNTALADGIRAFISGNFGNPDLGLAMVADRFRMSENYLSNLYKEQEGECVSETIEGVRLAAAREMLSSGGERLESVAAACGYRSVASFRRAFKRVLGVSPSDYRRSASGS